VTLYEMWKHIRIPPPIRTTHHVCTQNIGRNYSSNSLSKNILSHNTLLNHLKPSGNYMSHLLQ
jgi:hypothetical protein